MSQTTQTANKQVGMAQGNLGTYLVCGIVRAHTIADVSSAVQDAFTSFMSNSTVLALPLRLKNNVLEALPTVCSKLVDTSFQQSLSILDDVLKPTVPLYLLLRRGKAISAITFLPYQADENQREQYLHYRHELVELLGGKNFETSFICKEVGEITDARSWVERDEHRSRTGSSHEASEAVKDAGYKKNKCRLCDRRMKNMITDESLEALKSLQTAGDYVQIVHKPSYILYIHAKPLQSLNADLVLALDSQISSLAPDLVSSQLPTTKPTFTFYRHPNNLTYFIFHSPDSATVQQRMKHTVAIPGLVNVHAEDYGVHIDQKIEIHDPEELVFDTKDERVGRFRSMYLRGSFQGTESQYEALGRDAKFYDAVR